VSEAWRPGLPARDRRAAQGPASPAARIGAALPFRPAPSEVPERDRWAAPVNPRSRIDLQPSGRGRLSILKDFSLSTTGPLLTKNSLRTFRPNSFFFLFRRYATSLSL